MAGAETIGKAVREKEAIETGLITDIQEHIVSPAPGSTVVKSEPDGWLTRTLWSDGTVSWHGSTEGVQRVKAEVQGRVVVAYPSQLR